VIVVIGWVLLLAAAQLNHFFASFSGSDGVGNASFNVDMIAQCTIWSGFGIAIICTLQTGFGALHQFFDAVLVRSGKAQFEMPRDLRAERKLAAGALQIKEGEASSAKSTQTKLVTNKLTQGASKAQTGIKKIVERGWVKDRAYVLFADGAVEVETMLGLRRFASLQEAHDFIS
jgi:hypothetical protein